HAGASGFGLLSSIMAIGTIAGALVAAGREPAAAKAFDVVQAIAAEPAAGQASAASREPPARR
ncbi:hypothetical protein QZM99_27120, partial [Burkholderia gladioli]|nr:hypothetical protein [Burkholderia gladioli]